MQGFWHSLFQSIFHPLYLFSALLIACFYLRLQGLSWAAIFSRLTERSQWFSSSSLLDLKFTLLYLVFLRILVAKVEDTSFQFLWGRTVETLSPWHFSFSLPLLWEGILATVVTMLSIDFASYLVHYFLHKNPWAWKIHSVHHSAETLTPLTTYRQHPLEPIFLYSMRGAAAALGLAIFHSFFPQKTPVILVYGLGAGFFVYMLTVNLHHFPMRIRYPKWLCFFLVSPHVHHIHHSKAPEHHDKNFGVVFSIWDRIFGTYLEDKAEDLSFGLHAQEQASQSLIENIFLTSRRRRQNFV